ncbi:hypothetical protein A2468_01610 [Candidatus Falkowbacteria bacterium RIFOXYC2_FULL_46_15]|nr:MAG: hypothetical protein A2468_01610 [Candidatus Falkowbacteria bacterium RIFOXYC2_FULL_46_15]
MKQEKDPNELIMYLIVNQELNMSPPKIGIQMAHVATNISNHMMWAGIGSHFSSEKYKRYEKWLHHNGNEQKKIALKARQSYLIRLVALGFFHIRDKGYTEVPAGSLTCVGLGIITRQEAEPFVKRLQLLK